MSTWEVPQIQMTAANSSNLPKLWIYNYDFEFELAKKNQIVFDTAFPYPWHFLNRSTNLLLPLSNPNDAIVVYEAPPRIVQENLSEKLGYWPRIIPLKPDVESNSLISDLMSVSDMLPQLKDNFHLSPWGWSGTAIDFAKRVTRSTNQIPSISTIRTVNSKYFSQQLREMELPSDFSIPALHIAPGTSLNDLETAANTFSTFHPDFYVKHHFGTAGYLMDVCRSIAISEGKAVSKGKVFSTRKLKKWKSWLKQGQGLLLEKRVSVVREYSLQLEINKGKGVDVLTLTTLLSRKDNHYQGTVIDDRNVELVKKLSRQLRPVFDALVNSGYKGPAGIDLIQTQSGEFKLLEINARFTMGRVAYEWHKKINQFPVGLFSHFFTKKTKLKSLTRIFGICNHLEKEYNCSILIINFISLDGFKKSMIGIFVGARSEEIIWQAVNALKSSLYVE